MRIYQVTKGTPGPSPKGPAALGRAPGTRALLSCRRRLAPCSCCTPSPGPAWGSWRPWCVSGGVAVRRVSTTKSPGEPGRACPRAVSWAPRPLPAPASECPGPGALPRARGRCPGRCWHQATSGSHVENVKGNEAEVTETHSCGHHLPDTPVPVVPAPTWSPWARPGPRSKRAGPWGHRARLAVSLDGEPEAWGPVLLPCAPP